MSISPFINPGMVELYWQLAHEQTFPPPTSGPFKRRQNKSAAQNNNRFFDVSQEATLQSLCKSCGVETSGSRIDLVFRLREKLTNRQTYVDVYQSICGASGRYELNRTMKFLSKSQKIYNILFFFCRIGGWSVVACPHGIVYSLKFNLQTESPRDFSDLLLSWKHFPNVCLYDSAHGLATHTNSRVPDDPPFHPHDGKPVPPTEENVARATC